MLRHFLHSGGRVLIHCRGGLGRTGTLAARLLMEEGQDAESAMGAVRAVRPGAIETEAQESYLYAFRIKDDLLESREELSGLSRIRVEQLLRLMLEVPWAFRHGWNGSGGNAMVSITRAGWRGAIKACLRQDAMEKRLEAAEAAPETLREILAALYDACGGSLDHAREYFRIVRLPEPELPEL